jgi:hypothetical protein
MHACAQMRKSGQELGPGLQAALNAFTEKVPWLDVRNPTLYSLLPATPVRARHHRHPPP